MKVFWSYKKQLHLLTITLLITKPLQWKNNGIRTIRQNYHVFALLGKIIMYYLPKIIYGATLHRIELLITLE